MVSVCTAAPSLSSPQPFAVCPWQQVKVKVTVKGELPTCLDGAQAEDLPCTVSSSVA